MASTRLRQYVSMLEELRRAGKGLTEIVCECLAVQDSFYRNGRWNQSGW